MKTAVVAVISLSLLNGSLSIFGLNFGLLLVAVETDCFAIAAILKCAISSLLI